MRLARTELLCAGILLAVAVAFWVQRESTGRLTEAFPDFVLVVLVLLAVGIAVRALLRKQGEATDETPVSTVDKRFLAAAMVVLPVWAIGMGLVGFTISGVLAFVVLAQLIRRERPRPVSVARDTVVGAVLVVAAFLVFTRVLLVPLPVSVLIGM